ncbi:MAG TPA: hypothetical protein VMH22_07030 [bacterium]|nr:hypothetical protein [bacterium]
MRRLLVLCLAVGLAHAGREQWVGHGPCGCRPNPNPRLGGLSSPSVLFPAATDMTDVMCYDTGEAVNFWFWFRAGNGWGMKFISPKDSITLAGALLYVDSMGANKEVIVKVYADDGAHGSPGTLIATDTASDTSTLKTGHWSLVPIWKPIVGRNFYIFYVQAVDSIFGLSLGEDGDEYAPGHRQWKLYNGKLSEDHNAPFSNWMIRAVLDWTPQDTNAASVRFATDMPDDTISNVNFPIRTTIRNMGSDTLPVGTPVRLHITGPRDYVFDESTATAARLPHGATEQMNFLPVWHIPKRPGYYSIRVATEAAGEKWPADDTIAWDMFAGGWCEYIRESPTDSLTWAGPERAVKFDPTTFLLQYPVGIAGLRADFCSDSLHPWDDSSFTFKVYGGDGQTLLYQSETLEATPGSPTVASLDSMVVIDSGDFYVAVVPVSSTGFPSTAGDSMVGGHSYHGSPGDWILWPSPARAGEWDIATAVEDRLGIAESHWSEVSISKPAPTIVRGMLRLASGEGRMASCWISPAARS